MRSEPGKGKKIRLFRADAVFVGDPLSWWDSGTQEDYAVCAGAMYVKVDPDLPAPEAAKLLRNLANTIERQGLDYFDRSQPVPTSETAFLSAWEALPERQKILPAIRMYEEWYYAGKPADVAGFIAEIDQQAFLPF